MRIKRGDVFYAQLDKGIGSEQKGTRPVVIIQNDSGNRHSPTVIVACLTRKERELPVHCVVGFKERGYHGTILAEQIQTIDKSRMKEKIGHLTEEELYELNRVLKVSIAID